MAILNTAKKERTYSFNNELWDSTMGEFDLLNTKKTTYIHWSLKKDKRATFFD